MTIKQIDIAVVGAASLAGETVLAMLAERKFPLATLYAVDVVAQSGSHVEYKDEPLPIHELANFDFEQVQLAIFLADAPLAAEYVPKAVAAGCIVVDSSVCFGYEKDVPLLVPGINDEVIAAFRERMIVAIPSSATCQLLKAIKPIDDAVGIESLQVTVLQPVSEAGKAGQEELGQQTAQLLNFQEAEKTAFPVQVAFNVIPESGIVLDNGHSTDELNLIKGTHKVLSNDKISMQALIVTVPVFYGHGVSISLRTRDVLGADKAMKLLDNVPGLKVVTKTGMGRPTPVTDASGQDDVIIGRIRAGLSDSEHELSLWCVADNIRSGLALSSVQTAEILVKDYL